MIQSFQTEVVVLSSKQRPRKMGIVGSDGREWSFLLKGQGDLTQDERIMQVSQGKCPGVCPDDSSAPPYIRRTRRDWSEKHRGKEGVSRDEYVLNGRK